MIIASEDFSNLLELLKFETVIPTDFEAFRDSISAFLKNLSLSCNLEVSYPTPQKRNKLNEQIKNEKEKIFSVTS